MRVCALIPVYNNAGTIADVVDRCRKVIEPDVLVVSDGSTDGSDDRAREAGCEVLALPENEGKGNAIVRGLEHLKEREYTHALVVDADGQHLPEEIPQMLESVWNFPERIWIGVRRMNEPSVPTSSKRGRSISNFWTTVNGWQRCLDAQCGFRVYPVDEVLALGCREPGFQFEMEVLIRAAWAGMRLGHVEVGVHYPDDGRVSHFDMSTDNWRFTWLSFKMFWGMIARSPSLAYRRLSG